MRTKLFQTKCMTYRTRKFSIITFMSLFTEYQNSPFHDIPDAILYKISWYYVIIFYSNSEVRWINWSHVLTPTQSEDSESAFRLRVFQAVEVSTVVKKCSLVSRAVPSFRSQLGEIFWLNFPRSSDKCQEIYLRMVHNYHWNSNHHNYVSILHAHWCSSETETAIKK